ncbi:MAG: HAD family hydrolase [Myxococcales bacterium]|nr:HAD family hydrolase [Myxococcales bacterium]MCA9658921.1 HAD family hydrolase [Myxococcales bacterium]
MSAGPAIAAFFDVDRTLLAVNSGELWVRHMWREGQLGPGMAARSILWILQYRLGLLDFEAVTERAARGYAGRSVAELADEVGAWFRSEIAASMTPAGRRCIDEHRAAGHRIALLTSGTRFVAEPVARMLEVASEDILCTELEVDDGRLTGRHLPPACGGAGKVTRAEAYAEAAALDLDASFFYTDSYSDLPMLMRVGNPRVINPDSRLRRFARRRGWPVETWAPGEPTPADG